MSGLLHPVSVLGGGLSTIEEAARLVSLYDNASIVSPAGVPFWDGSAGLFCRSG